MAHHHAPQNTQGHTACEEDGGADAFATVALVFVVVSAVCYWLSNMA
jgi:hypothetical protein